MKNLIVAGFMLGARFGLCHRSLYSFEHSFAAGMGRSVKTIDPL